MRERSSTASCARKTAFASKGRAKRALRELRERARKGQAPDWKALQLYQCDCCGNFHLGHDPAWLKRHRLKRPLPTFLDLGISA